MEKPASRRAFSPSGYNSPTIVEMFGLSSPVPSTIRASPSQISAAPLIGIAMQMWPSMMIEPPTSTALRAPSTRSAIQPPGSASR